MFFKRSWVDTTKKGASSRWSCWEALHTDSGIRLILRGDKFSSISLVVWGSMGFLGSISMVNSVCGVPLDRNYRLPWMWLAALSSANFHGFGHGPVSGSGRPSFTLEFPSNPAKQKVPEENTAQMR